jgi:hypothetical protein
MTTGTESAAKERIGSQRNIFVIELTNHLRFTAFAVITAAVLILLARNMLMPASGGSAELSEVLFEGFFIAHLFFASLTPAALFSIYRRNILLALTLAISSSALTCTLSDIIFPYLGGLLLNYDMSFHVCIIEEPITSWAFIIGGALLGYFLSQFIRKLSRYTHTAHILLSSLAAGLYLVSFGVEFLSLKALLFLPILIFSVLIPCVTNDVGVPSFIVSRTLKTDVKKKQMLEELHAEHHGHGH